MCGPNCCPDWWCERWAIPTAAATCAECGTATVIRVGTGFYPTSSAPDGTEELDSAEDIGNG